MEAILHRRDVVDGLSKMGKVLSSKEIQRLNTLWIDVQKDIVRFLGGDGVFECVITSKAEVVCPGLIGVNGKLFVELIKRMPDDSFRLKLEGRSLEITQDKRRYKLASIDSDYFEDFFAFPLDRVLCFGGELKNAINKVLFCVSQEDVGNGMFCLSMKKNEAGVEFCGLNGPQMAIYQTSILEDLVFDQILISKNNASKIKNVLSDVECEIGFEKNRFFIQTLDGKEFYSFPTGNYSFPNYADFLSKQNGRFKSKLTVNKEGLISELYRLSVFIDDDKSVRFIMRQDEEKKESKELFLTSISNGVGEGIGVVDCEYCGDVDNIVLFYPQLIDMLCHFDKDVEISFEFCSNGGPVRCSSVKEGFVVYMMPVCVSK